jgi:aspartate carbamoyltransferase catalytic subunit
MVDGDIQFAPDGRLRHCLTTEGMGGERITEILDLAESFAGVNDKTIKKVPLLRGHTVVNLFFESSTRTRSTFELAAKRLSADVLNIDVQRSATSKGESLLDTIANLQAMQCDLFVMRHPESMTTST